MDSRSDELYTISRELNASLDLDHVLDALLEASLRLLSAPLGYIVLVDQETGSRFLRCTRGFGHTSARDHRSSVAEWVLGQSRPLVLNPSDGGGVSVDSVTGAAAAIGVPVASADGVVGVSRRSGSLARTALRSG